MYRRLFGPERQEERRDADGHRGDQREVPGQERERQHEQGRRDDGDQAHHVLRDEQVGDPLDVADHPAALGQHRRHVRELAVQQHQLGDRLGGLRAVAHRDPDVGVLERERVVDAVAGHRDHVPVALQRLHQHALLLGRHPAENRCLLGDLAQFLRVDADRAGIDDVIGPDIQTDPAGDGADRRRVVAGDDLDPDALILEVLQRLRGVRPDLFGERDQRHRRHPGRQLLALQGGVGAGTAAAPGGRSPRAH